MKSKIDKYVGEIIRINDSLRGKCIGYAPLCGELVYIHGKGGQIGYIKAENIMEKNRRSINMENQLE